MSREVRKVVLSAEAEKRELERKASNVVTFLIFPVLIGLLGAFTQDIEKFHGLLAILLWGILLLLYGVFWWRAYPSNESIAKLMLDNENMEDKILDLEDNVSELSQSIQLLLAQSTLSFATRFMVVEYVKRGIDSLPALRESISELAAPLYLEGEPIFGIGGSERWNFAVYLYSKQQDILTPVWRMKASNHPSQGDGRTWGRGQGHVGKAFVDGQTIITPDALHPEVVQLSAAPRDRELDYDREVYRSFASVPIGPIAEAEGLPYGVLVGTSDRIGRFDRENAAILVHVAAAVASLVALAGIDIDHLRSEESATVDPATETPNAPA